MTDPTPDPAAELAEKMAKTVAVHVFSVDGVMQMAKLKWSNEGAFLAAMTATFSGVIRPALADAEERGVSLSTEGALVWVRESIDRWRKRCEAHMEQRDEAVAERDKAQSDLALAANELNMSGPVHKRIQLLKDSHTALIAERDALRALLREVAESNPYSEELGANIDAALAPETGEEGTNG